MGRHLLAMEQSNQKSLMHYGRKGMKWGQHLFTSDEQIRKAIKKRNALQSSKQYKDIQKQIDEIVSQMTNYRRNTKQGKKASKLSKKQQGFHILPGPSRKRVNEAWQKAFQKDREWGSKNPQKKKRLNQLIKKSDDMYKKAMGFERDSKKDYQLNDAYDYLNGPGGKYF